MKDAATQEGRTVLYVSHNMNTIRQLCNRCIVLDHGKVVFDGDTEEAIGVYMNRNYETGVIFDYSQIKRSPNEIRNMQMLGIEIRNKEKNVFSQGEKCYLTLHCICNSTVNNVGFRFEIFHSDGSIVGTVFTDKEVSAKTGQKIDLKLALDTDNLAPGSYKAVALAYERDCFGNQIGVDRVDPALFFEIAQSENANLVWLTQYWGHIKFDDMLIEDIEIVN
jgi:lipopolysaccharide transport system ATP-binding protein